MSGTEWFLETDRLRLRRLTVDDAAFMLAIWNDPDFIRYVGDRGLRTQEDAAEALTEGALRLYQDYGYGPYGMSLKQDGTMVGICGLFRRANLEHPDIGFAVLPDYSGIGLASEAAAAVVAHAREDLGIDYLIAIVSPENRVSVALIRKLGLEFERAVTMPGETRAISLYGAKLV